jgi:hypothetical protein
MEGQIITGLVRDNGECYEHFDLLIGDDSIRELLEEKFMGKVVKITIEVLEEV